MNQERWHQIKSTVALAMEAPETKRSEVIHSMCGTDSDLRHEVETLLAAAATAESLPQARAAIASAVSSLASDEDASFRQLLESVLGNQYEIIRPLGRGGMGWVYLARERALERLVAIKVLRPELAMAESHRERFRREARIAARLTHPGILGLHSFGEIGNLWYFVMTYIRGETLADRIRREGFLPWADALRIFTEMADALDCAHRNGVVHRDIKPANILLDGENGHAILADFGISKMFGIAENLTATGAIMGTPAYMSPEQVMGASDLDERADIYSLGAVAYVMLTGREPFRSDSPAATAYRRLVVDATPVDSIVASIPPDLSAVVQKCMARERDGRWPNAKVLREALDNILASDRLPNVVRDVRSFGLYSMAWLLGWIAFATLTPRLPTERPLLAIVALVAPIGLVLHLWNGAARGMRLVDLARIALWPPEWWSMWWPRGLRRPADMWDRLPWRAKAVRILVSASLPALLTLILLRGKVYADVNAFYETWVEAGEWAILVAVAAGIAAAFAWAKGQGLVFDQSIRLLLGPTLPSNGWKEPALTALLAPASGKVRAPSGDAPSDYLRAIRELIPHVPQSPSDSGVRAAKAGESIVRAIEKCDNELAELTRDAGPGEANRLSTQLDALDAGGTGDTQERRELRDLVSHQLDLVRRMQSRREIVLRRRAQLMDMLGELWAIIREVGESRDGDPEGTVRLDRLCAEIGLEVEAAAD